MLAMQANPRAHRRNTTREFGSRGPIAAAEADRFAGPPPESEAIVEFNRNHYLALGVLLLLAGLQLRLVDSYVLNEPTTKFINARISQVNGQQQPTGYPLALGPTPRRVVQPPAWLGWCLMSVGSVLVLHSLALNRPSG